MQGWTKLEIDMLVKPGCKTEPPARGFSVERVTDSFLISIIFPSNSISFMNKKGRGYPAF